MELRNLRHFVAVAEERSFTAAGRRLHLGQSALSTSIRALERDLGTILFHRTTRMVVTLTQAGHALLPRATRLLEAATRTRHAVREAAEGRRGSSRIGLMQALTTVDLAAILGRFRDRRPNVELHFESGTPGSAHHVERVAAGDLDLAFVCWSENPPSGVRLIPLATEPLVLAYRRGHLFDATAPKELARLAELPSVTFPPSWGLRRTVDRTLRAQGVPHVPAIEIADVVTCVDMNAPDSVPASSPARPS